MDIPFVIVAGDACHYRHKIGGEWLPARFQMWLVDMTLCRTTKALLLTEEGNPIEVHLNYLTFGDIN